MERSQRGWRGYVGALGPGLVTGASDDDPSGVATYAQAGARFGYQLLWTSLLTLPLMATVQEICDRTALATGQNLGELTHRRFQRRGRAVIGLLLVLLLVANALNITADLLAVGAGMQLLGAGPVALWAAIAGVAVVVLVISGSFQAIERVFKVLCIGLLAYVAVLFFADLHWRQVATDTLLPHLDRSADYLALVVAVLGTTISPYLFFWQSAHRVESLAEENEGPDAPADDEEPARAVPLRERTRADAKATQRRSRFDVFTGIGLSNLVMFAIIAASAATIGAHGSTQVDSAAAAAAALRPVAGSAATWLFALGFIGTGMLAVPVLAASASTGLAGLTGHPWGFSRSARQAPFFYGLVVLGTLGGTALSVLHANPITLLVAVAVINGVVAAPFLVVVMLVSGDRAIMGDQRNRRLAAVVGWLTVTVMAMAALALGLTTLVG